MVEKHKMITLNICVCSSIVLQGHASPEGHVLLTVIWIGKSSENVLYSKMTRVSQYQYTNLEQTANLLKTFHSVRLEYLLSHHVSNVF